jgi:ATP-dependent DNA helicase PIF1
VLGLFFLNSLKLLIRSIDYFKGIGLGEGDNVTLALKVCESRRYRDRWNKCAILIIDEISMIDAELFNKLDYIGKIARRNTAAPFGGIQLILSGDFLQLPPVNNVGVDEELFCFESKAWREAITHCVSLRDVYRQKDAEFVRALNEIRHGQYVAGCFFFVC